MANENSRPEDYNEETFETFDEAPVEEQPESRGYEDYVAPEQEPEVEDDLPEKYKGKDVKDIVAMHQNAEKLLGKQSSEVGELRKVVDNFIQTQTIAQQQKQAPVQAEDDLDDLDFFENPKQAISRMLENHPSVQQSRQMANHLAQQNTVAQLKANHPDFTNIVSDAKFIEWVGKSKVRSQLLRQADAYDYDSADELFTSWKERQQMVNSAVQTETNARRQSVKSGSTGNTKGSGEPSRKKIYRRADIVELMAKDPERYQSLAAEIRQAYSEGRVK
ncbi:hypothetical protein [Paraglaciecola sp.]|uniref:hypothetical protein n=1 Tax=Paraglaciecola sp. TaxID=1920173 RepID=UPI003EFA1233